MIARRARIKAFLALVLMVGMITGAYYESGPLMAGVVCVILWNLIAIQARATCFEDATEATMERAIDALEQATASTGRLEQTIMRHVMEPRGHRETH